MDIIKENLTEQTSVIKIKIQKSDYEEKYEKSVRDYKKHVKIDGFRPGMVPNGLVKKMYGKALLYEEVNKLITDSLNNYIKENSLKIIGDPIPSESNDTIDLDNLTEFEFSFDIGLYPEFELKLNKKEKYPYFDIAIEDKMIEDEINYYANYFGELKPVKTVNADDITIEGEIQEVDKDGNIIKNGVKAEDIKIYLPSIKDEESRKKFNKAKINDNIIFNPKVALPNDTDRSLLLKVTKDEVKDIESDFMVTIKAIKKFEKSEINQALYDKVFGEGTVKTDEEFKEKIKENLKSRFESESNYKFRLDSKEKLIEKTDISLPEDFLKRWVILVNKSLSQEQIDNEFPMFIQDLKWQLIKEKIMLDNNYKVSEEDLKKEALLMAKYQFAQYGINNISEEHAQGMIDHIMKDEKTLNKLQEKIIEDKIFDFVKENVKLENKEITINEFQELLKTNNN